ncbi:hypothetical protein mRhiFer1_010291 [Rhinolophus ferrumequinum]|uniref:Uncharacterized protein n=1 Tax=Rhinolophus ferrumequinum TaxID=59479 RepID=A0A7J7X5F3_RHIFE|nr:hypothetical protein mRhiFer1_010291 [Rhinolophus ferrumequinum]
MLRKRGLGAAARRQRRQLRALGRALRGCCGAGRVAPLNPPGPGCLRNSALGLWGAKCNPNPVLPSPAQINTHKHSHRRRRGPRSQQRVSATGDQGRARNPRGAAARDRPLKDFKISVRCMGSRSEIWCLNPTSPCFATCQGVCNHKEEQPIRKKVPLI